MRRRHRRSFSAVVFLIVLSMFLAACGDDATETTTTTAAPGDTTTVAPETSTTIADATTTTEAATTTSEAMSRIFDTGYGEPVEIPEVPSATYVWGVQGMETLAVIGVEPVAYSNRFEAVPPWVDVTWNSAVALGQPPAVENLVALQPDLLISDEGNDVVALEGLAPILTIRANSIQDTIDQLLIMGDIYEKRDAAEAFVADFNARLQETKDEIAGAAAAPRVMIIYPGVEPGVFGMWLDSSFIGSIMEELGSDYALKLAELTGDDTAGDNDERATRFGLVQLGLEKVIDVDPDYLFVLGSPAEDLIAELATNAAWGTLSAVQNDQVFGFDRDLWSRSRGPIAMSLILGEARHALYPDIFDDPTP